MISVPQCLGVSSSVNEVRMAIFLPERTASAAGSLTPREIVAELDKHVIGQGKAKRAVAIALRNRIRRQRLPQDIADEVTGACARARPCSRVRIRD